MTRSRRARRLGPGLTLALAAVLAPASAAHAEATVFGFEVTSPIPDSTALPECLPPDLIGTQAGSETFSGQVTDTGRTFQVHGTGTMVYRVTFPDGRYVDGTAVDHLVFVLNAPLTVFNDVIQEPRTIYSATGEPVGQVIIHALSHVTYQDVNGNGTPDPGEISAQVDSFFFTCH